eukprot:gene23991-15350_t
MASGGDSIYKTFDRLLGVDDDASLNNTNPIYGVDAAEDLPLREALLRAQLALGLSTSQIKTICGGATLKARKLREQSQMFGPLTEEMAKAVHAYTQGSNLYSTLNSLLRDENRDKLRTVFCYIRLLLTAFARLPSESNTFYRGVDKDLGSTHKKGATIVWWSVTSVTSKIEVMNKFMKGSHKTIYSIAATNAKNVKMFSAFPEEDERIIPPGTVFVVEGVVQISTGVTIVQLKQDDEIPTLIDAGEDSYAILDPGGGSYDLFKPELAQRRCTYTSPRGNCTKLFDPKNAGQFFCDIHTCTAASCNGKKPSRVQLCGDCGSTAAAVGAKKHVLYHGTTIEAAQQIMKDGHLAPSEDGIFGGGVYLTSSKKKAVAWAGLRGEMRSQQPVLITVSCDLGNCKTFDMKGLLYGDDFYSIYHTSMDAGPKCEALITPILESKYKCKTWIAGGFDSQFIPETRVAVTGGEESQTTGKELVELWSLDWDPHFCSQKDSDYALQSINYDYIERMAGDEYVVADGKRVQYISHELITTKRPTYPE